MAYTVLKLITNAYYLSGVVSRDFQTVSDQDGLIGDGLDLLNDILEDKTVENDMVPYFLKYTFNSIQGQETYFIPNLIQLETLVFFINSVRYQMREFQRRKYFGSSRANNIESLPFTYHVERCFGGANLYLYFLPDINYPMEAWGQFRLVEVVINQDLSLTVDRFYINYLKYALAERICIENDYDVPEGLAMQLAKYQSWISKRSQQLDLQNTYVSTLQQNNTINYAQLNLGKGWSTN